MNEFEVEAFHVTENCFKGNSGETSERRDGAHNMGFPEPGKLWTMYEKILIIHGKEIKCASRGFTVTVTCWHPPLKTPLSECTVLDMPEPTGGHCGRRSRGSHCWEPKADNVLPLKPGIRQNTATHALPTAKRSFLFANFYLVSPFIWVFCPNSLPIF